MNAELRAMIPARLLAHPDTRGLRDWLGERGQHLTLTDLDAERHRRGIVPPIRRKGGRGTDIKRVGGSDVQARPA